MDRFRSLMENPVGTEQQGFELDLELSLEGVSEKFQNSNSNKLPEVEGEWLTNCREEDYEKLWEDLSSDDGNPILKGKPKGNEHYTLEELENLGMVGVYESKYDLNF